MSNEFEVGGMSFFSEKMVDSNIKLCVFLNTTSSKTMEHAAQLVSIPNETSNKLNRFAQHCSGNLQVH